MAWAAVPAASSSPVREEPEQDRQRRRGDQAAPQQRAVAERPVPRTAESRMNM